MQGLLSRVGNFISDYREGEIERPDARHVQRWIEQFDKDKQKPILSEVAHVLERTYISKAAFRKFLIEVVRSGEICGSDHRRFWRNAKR